MAEAAGLALGVAALVSTCLDCFALFQSSRAHGREFEILLIKLDVEKTRLLQWSEMIGLLSSDSRYREQLLMDQTKRTNIEKRLNCIIMLFTDSEKLRSKYGMLEDSQREDLNTKATNRAVVSRPRLQKFRDTYAAFCNRIASRQQNTGVLAKAKWAIRDREAFSNLIKDLHDLIESLYDFVLVPPSISRLMVDEDIERLPDNLEMLRLLEEACSDRADEWSDAASSRRQTSESASEKRYQSTAIASEDERQIIEWRRNIHTREELRTIQTFDEDMKMGEYYISPSHEKKRRVTQDDYEDSVDPFQRRKRLNGNSVPMSSDPYRAPVAKRTPMPMLGYAVENHFVEYGICSAEYGILNDDLVKPSNILEIKRRLAQCESTGPPDQEFKNFMRVSAFGSDIIQFLVSDITQGETRDIYPIRDLPLRFGEPLTDGRIGVLKPDLCCCARSDRLHRRILNDLNDQISPSTTKRYLIVPNFFLEISKDGTRPSDLRVRAFHGGALGARGILSLQSYQEPTPRFDGNAYALSTTYHDGTLRIYAVWPTKSYQSEHTRDLTQYGMVLVGAWVMDDSPEGYREGLTAFRNAIRLTEHWRDMFIGVANAKEYH